MLQIRLSKGTSGDGGGGTAAKSLSAGAETVTVACPDHLVLADLPVAKSLGASTTSAASSVRSVGRRSRRHLGERVHFCVRCDFPIAVYGRLVPCEHAFCLACARTDSSCYLCDERIQKIQTIKIMEGIFICAAPHCLKSFLKRAEFESHIHETHADLLQSNVEKEGGSEANALNSTRPSSIDSQKQALLPEISTARAPPRSGFSPSSSSQLQDRDERMRRHQSRDPSPRPPLQPKPPPFLNRQQSQTGDSQADNNPPHGFDRPYNWFPQSQQRFDNQSGPHYQQNSDQAPPDITTVAATETSFPNYPPPLPLQPPNYPIPVNANQVLVPTPSFVYPPLPPEGSQPYYTTPFEMPRPEVMPESGSSEQVSVLGIPPSPAVVSSFQDNYPRPWSMGLVAMSMPFQALPVGQSIPDGFTMPTDPQGGVSFLQGDYGRMPEGLQINLPFAVKDLEQQGGSADRNINKGGLVLQPLSLPPPPPLPPLPSQQQQQHLIRGNFSGASDGSRDGQGFGWQNDKHGFGNGPD